MNEIDLRQRVVDIALGWEGATPGSQKHLDILNTYNLHAPLARGHAVTVGEPWCATMTSATWIAAGVAEWTGTECSCSKLIELARARGIWQERDDYVPKLGDAPLYDWDDGADYARTDNEGAPEHIGIVVKSGMGAFVVLEGNKGSGHVCGRRTLMVNGRYIRGFITPKYAEYAAALSAHERQMFSDVTKDAWYAEAVKWAVGAGIADGYPDGTFRPAGPLSRAEAIVMLKRLADYLRR